MAPVIPEGAISPDDFDTHMGPCPRITRAPSLSIAPKWGCLWAEQSFQVE